MMSLLKLLLIHYTLFTTSANTQSLYQEDYSSNITIGDTLFEAEIANTPHKMQMGMMYRPSMKDTQSMVFIYPQPQPTQFWMKNTLIPLDMLFFDSAGTLLEIKHNVLPCKIAHCPIYHSQSALIKYVVELKGGISATANITLGDKLNGSGF